MSLELCILASGSSGNCAVVRTPAGVVLIDAGIGPAIARQRLSGTGVTLDDVRAICLTHLDRDHFRASWCRHIAAGGIHVFVAESRLAQLRNRAHGHFERYQQPPPPQLEDCWRPFGTRPFEVLPGIRATPMPLEHDVLGSHGFVLSSTQHRLGYATDLGRFPDALFEHFADLDILALESNYDAEMQLASPRPFFLKQRVMGGSGHLSNRQAYDAICAIIAQAQRGSRKLPAHIVLLHRSRECNCPRIVRKLFNNNAALAGRLTLAEQYRRTQWLRAASGVVCAGEQLVLSWV